MDKIANSWWMYLLGIVVVIFVLAGSGFFIWKSYKDAKQLNMDKKILRQTIINSAVFTILPSISILIGVVTLSGILGLPLPWIRLTVIGALHYEGLAANAAYPGISSISQLNPEQFVTIAFVMTLGILSGPLYCLFGFKAYDKKLLSKTKVEFEESHTEEQIVTPDEPNKKEKKEKKSFGTVLFNAVFIAMICSFLAVDISKNYTVQINDGNSDYLSSSLSLSAPFTSDTLVWSSSDENIAVVNEKGKVSIKDKGEVTISVTDGEKTETFKINISKRIHVPLLVIAVTFISMLIFDILQKKLKLKWLASFDLGLSMLIGMAVAVLIG